MLRPDVTQLFPCLNKRHEVWRDDEALIVMIEVHDRTVCFVRPTIDSKEVAVVETSERKCGFPKHTLIGLVGNPRVCGPLSNRTDEVVQLERRSNSCPAKDPILVW